MLFSTITRLTSHNITVFVHQTSIQTEGFRYLKDGEEVEFEIHESDKGPQAVERYEVPTNSVGAYCGSWWSG